MRRGYAALAALLAFLSACAPQVQRLTSVSQPRPDWAFEASDIPVEPAYRFGKLPNGMRYVIRHNANPKGTVMVRMEVAAGSLDESGSELGFAHFVEHMAFNGSTNVPEGEMVRLLERNGLAFGADTNASTSFQNTTYMLDLPRNDDHLVETALMLMRETASELTFAPEAVARERGVILAEMRDRNSWQLRNAIAQAKFLHPKALYPARFPIGAIETLNAATAQSLQAFWQREYVPSQTTVIVIGDIDPATVEKAVAARFGNWKASAADPQPDAGPVNADDGDRTEVYIDQALSERIVASRHGPWIDGPDSRAQRQEELLRQIGYGIVNRRMQRIARRSDPPFRAAGFGTGDVFRSGRTTNLVVDTVDAKWRKGLIAAATEYRRALQYGFTAAEIAEQVANVEVATRNAAASAATRTNGGLVNAVFGLLRDDMVPSTPESVLERLQAFIPEITPERVLAALKREAVPLDKPLLRFQGRKLPVGGAHAIRAAWNEATHVRLTPGEAAPSAGFAYTDFGPPGAVASDSREPALGIRTIRFGNGVRLNLKRTDLEAGRVLVKVSVDGGEHINTRDNPIATQMVPYLPVGGLGRHSQDALQSILAGHTVSTGISVGADAFVSSAQTTPDDLELQLQLFAAFVADPGYRLEGEVQYRLNINNFFAQKDATPFSALQNAIGAIVSANDPRFSLQDIDAYRRLTFEKLKGDLADRLKQGAIEIGIVGDMDEEKTIAMVARTFGALAPRETEFRNLADAPPRTFTADRERRVIRHTGPTDQALIRLTWPTRDDRDPLETLKLELLERIVRIELTDTLREKLGKAYSPSASSSPSRNWVNYGTFGIAASVDVHEVAATQLAIAETLAELRDKPVSDDLLLRARAPIIEGIDNGLKSNSGWLSLVDRAQSEADRIDRYLKSRDRMLALKAGDIQDMARHYLTQAGALEILVLPQGAAVPAP